LEEGRPRQRRRKPGPTKGCRANDDDDDVLYGCETWSPTLREGRRLRVFENRMLRRIFGRKRDEITEECRKLHKEEFNYLYSLPSIIGVIKPRRMTWPGHAARMGKKRGVHRILMGKREGKGLLGRPRLRWEDNIKMYLQEVGWGVHGLD